MTHAPDVAEIGDRAFGVHEVAALVASSARIALSGAARARIDAARAVVEAYAAGDEPVYGLNTGLGGNIGHRIDREAIRDFQDQLILGRNIGVGEPLPEPVCRAALLTRIIGMATGGSGVSRPALDLLVDLFNRRVTPVIPARGSISAGDLGLSAHMAAVVIGRGEAWLEGRKLAGAEALRAAGLAPARLEPKDGLALCNHSSPTSGHAALTLAELGASLMRAAGVAALSAQGYGANTRIFDARLNAARPAAGQEDAAALFRALLSGGSLDAAPTTVQDALSFRCLAPVFGTALSAFAAARREVEVEINGAADNPLVLVEDGLMLSTPNFHTPSIALAVDALCIAIAHVAAAGAQRVIKLMNPALSKLPRYLSPVGGASAGYVPLQKTAAALYAEIRLAAAPASLDAMPVSDSVEDIAPLTLLAVRKLAAQLATFKLLVTVEALVAAQAVDLRDGLSLSPPSQLMHDLIRARAPMLQADREAGADVMATAQALEDPSLLAALRDAAAPIRLPISPVGG